MSDQNNEKVVNGSTCLFCEKREEREFRKIKPSDGFIKSEMMAEEHVESIKMAIQELASGNIDDSLNRLIKIEEKMQTTLAFGELFDIENNGNKIH